MPSVKTNPAAPPPTRADRVALAVVGTYWHVCITVGLAYRRRVDPHVRALLALDDPR